MNKTKTEQARHTPGPWEYTYDESDLSYCQYVVTKKIRMEQPTPLLAPGEKIIARIASANPGGGAEANARVIAAAPLMLEALREAESHSSLRLPVKKSTWLKMCAAIARAEGR